MKPTLLNQYRGELLDLRERLTGAISRMSEIVLTDDQPTGEHDQKVSEGSDKEIVLESSEEAIRRQVMEALDRIDRGTFGLCQECHQPIDHDRLDAIPYASRCIDCERQVAAR